MTEEEKLILKGQLELDVKDAEKNVAQLQKQLASALKQKMLSGNSVSPLLLNNIKQLTQDLEVAQRNADGARRKLNEFGNEGKSAMGGLAEEVTNLGTRMAAVFSAKAAVDFGIKVASTRSQFQQLEIAFTTLLKSEEKANDLMGKAVELAAKTPFDLQGVASGARQLIAYGFESERVIDDLRRLGDVAAGLGLPLQRLTYLYGTTRVQGRLYARDMLQFTNSGIPMLDTLAKMYGKTTQEINQMVSAGKIGFEDIEKAIRKMTDEGGQFANLMEKQSKSIGGQWSNIQDAIASALNEIGKSNEGLINTALSGVSFLVENLQKIISTIGTVAVAFGTYKAALMAVAAAEKIAAMTRVAHIASLNGQNGAVVLLTKSFQRLNATMLANPYALIAAALAGLTMSMIKHQKAVESGAIAHEAFNEYVDKQNKKLEELKKTQEELIQKATDEKNSTELRKDAIAKLMEKYPQLLAYYSSEEEALKNISQLKQQIATIDLENQYKQDDLTYRGLQTQIAKLKADAEDYKREAMEEGSDAALNSYYAILEQIKVKEDLAKEIYDRMGDGRYDSLSNNYPQMPLPEETKPKNYKYWEEQKKDLTEKYHQLEDVNSDEGKKLKKQIEDVNKELEKWSLASPKKSKDNTKKNHDDVIKAEEQLNEDRIKLETDFEQRLIDLKNDGYEKQVEQANLNHNKEMASLDRQEQDKLKQLQEYELKKWKEENPTKDESLFTPTITELPEEWKTIFDALRALEVQNYVKTLGDMAKAEADSQTEMYGTVAQRRAKLEEDLNKSIENALPEYYDAAVASRDAALLAFDISNDPNIKRAFGDVNKMSKKTINESIDLLRNRLKTLNPENPEDLQTIAQVQEQIKLLEDARDTNPFEYWGSSLMDVADVMNDIIKSQNRFNEARERGDKDAMDAETDLQKRLKETLKQMAIGYGITSFVNGLQKASNLMKELAEASGDVRLGDAAEKMGALAQNLSAAAQGAAQGGWIGAIVGGVSDMLNQTIEAFTTAKMETQEMEQNAKAFRHEMEMAALAIDNTKFSNVFGTSLFDQMGEQWNKAQDALKAYNDRLNELYGTYDDVKEKVNKSTGLGIFAGIFLGDFAAAIGNTGTIGGLGFSKTVSNEFKAMQDAIQKGYNGLQSMLIKTTDYSGWANFWGKQDKFTSLGDLAPELWDEDGDFNVANAKMFLQTNTQITDIQKEEIQNVIDLYEAYEKAMESLEDSVSSLVGDSLSGVADKMLDAFLETGDAIANMSDLMGDFEKQMAKAAIQSLLMEKVFNDEAKENLVNLLASGNTADAVTYYEGLLDKANEFAPQINDFLSTFQNLDADTRSAETKGYAQASQDSINELNGRATAMQGMLYESNENTKIIKGSVEEIRNEVGAIMSQNERLLAYTSSMLDEVRGIHNDTGAMCEKLDEVVKSNDTINKNVSWIMDKGVKAL